MPHTKITQAFIDGLPYQDSGTLWVHNTELAGSTCPSASARKPATPRASMGTASNEARAVARDVLLPEIRRGVDPRAKQLSDDDQAYSRIVAGIRGHGLTTCQTRWLVASFVARRSGARTN
ncbi:hypothetical protein [Paracoccus sp. DMF]|uniref:hypothetical protein n=1 Tax=Paracoccus sp. DMF TaxID=400837 RepID=UPI0011036AC4|nr:hypothetical protein [Paracoccus sp. DMF]MCV2449039.1 hypothetical protein [Paracoccus sp. DMF]